jgi:hypothetical protein
MLASSPTSVDLEVEHARYNGLKTLGKHPTLHYNLEFIFTLDLFKLKANN